MTRHVHIASVMPLRRSLPSERLQHADRQELVRQMAFHLLAGVSEGLDLSDDRDVIRYLYTTPERYLAKTITSHMDDAINLTRETIEAAKEGLR